VFGILGLEMNFDNIIGVTCILCWNISNFKVANIPTQNASYAYKIIKIHFKSQNSKR